ncbi:MAG: zinc-dependent metalloprotease family protein [Acidobacteriota bacterium]
MNKLACSLLLLASFHPAFAAERAATPGTARLSADGVWRQLDAIPAETLTAKPWIRPTSGQALELNRTALDALLRVAPMEAAYPVRESKAVIVLPRPDGRFERFAFVESPIMQPGLQAKYPQLRAYLGQGLDTPAATVRFDISPLGFRAQVLQPTADDSTSPSTWYIDPVSGGNSTHYMSYFIGSLAASGETTCSTPTQDTVVSGSMLNNPGPSASGATDSSPITVVRNEFGIAVAATGEFSKGVAAAMSPPQAPTVPLILGVIQTTIGRINQILERDGPVRLLLMQNSDQLIYLDPTTDPYDTSVSDANLQMQFQNNINAVIGTTNYSFGHTFHWQTSGYRGDAGFVGSVCNDSKKALGFSATSNASGDYFYIDLVAHEIGHQLGATHTFNGVSGSCASVGGVPQWTAETAYEPGSGSTIMSYGGTCGTDNIVASVAPTGGKVPMYNLSSMIQIANFVTGVSCVIKVPTSNLHPGATPAVQGPFVVPSDTPFRLISPSAEFGGPNDSLSYSIEQFDKGPQRALGQDTGAGEPLFRVLAPSSLTERNFPNLQSVLNGTPSLGENVPRYSRNSSFRGVLRDNVAGAGGWSWGDINVQVVEVPNPGFKVTAPGGGGAYCGSPGNALGVTWNVANTNQAPINASTVDILMSTDNGQSFAWTLAADYPNNGGALLPLPAVPTTQARIKVQSSGGLFFSINSGPFEVASGPPTIAVQPVGVSICPYDNFTLSFTPGPGSPRHIQWYKDGSPIAGATNESLTVTNAQPWEGGDSGDYKVVITNGCGSVTSNTVRVQVGVTFDQLTPDPTPQACQDISLPSYARGVGAMTYQWIKEGTPLASDPRLTGVNGPTLSINRVRYEDEGGYWCRVQDQCETRLSTTATVTLPTPGWNLRTISGPIRRGTYSTDFAFDANRGVIVQYGGSHPDGQMLGDTWEWDGITWVQRSPAHTPGQRSQHSMTYDTRRKSVLLFGGYSNSPFPFNNRDVWAYDGNDWSLVSSSPDGPPANVALTGDITFDSVRGKLVMVYERSGPGGPQNDTWEFDSATATWSLASSGPGPEFSFSPIEFDAARGNTVGQSYWWSDAYENARTWTSTGAGWLTAPTSPPRYNPALAYDSVRRRITMHSCCRGQGPGAYRTDTYAFNGAQWGPVLPDITTSQQDAVIPYGMAFDSRRRAMVMIGSAYNDAYYSAEQTWEYRYRDRVMFDRDPKSANPVAGQTVQFSGIADGAPTLTYQWRRGTTNLTDGPGPGGSTISGSTTPTLTITSVNSNNDGGYQLVATNQCGAQSSATATLTVGGVGRVPGDRGSSGTPLRLTRSGSNVTLTWGPSCSPADNDYEVYEGTIGVFTSHTPRLCTTGGATSATFTASAGDRYFLVVARNATREGSYGLTSAGVERPQGGSACLPQLAGGCP